MRYLSVVFCASLMFIGGLQSSLAGDADKKPSSSCMEKSVIGYGFPNKMRSVANMNAVIQWMGSVKKKHGATYSQWHTALESKVECRQSGSDLHICNAHGIPCKERQVKSEK